MKRFIVGLLAALLVFTSGAYALDSNYVGIGAALHRPLYTDPFNWETQLNALVKAGVKWMRIGADWRSYQPEKRGEYNEILLEKTDKIVNALHANGIQMTFVLAYTPKWASSNPTAEKPQLYPPSDMTAWKEYVQFITNRYHGKITAWEVWNEPDYDNFWRGTVEEYFQMLKIAHGTIKKTDPNNLVLLGGLTVSKRDENNQTIISGAWLDNLMKLGGGDYFDIINYHAYLNTRQMDTKYQTVMEVVSRYPALADKKIWVTETGASSYVNKDEDGNILTDEAGKAEFLEQTYAQHKRYENIDRIYIYTFTNPTNNTDKENHFGLVTPDGEPLDAYYHFQALGGAQLDLSGTPSEKWQTLTYDTEDVTGGSIGLADGRMTLNTGSSLGLRINDHWIYDGNEGLEEQVYVDVDYAAGHKGAKWQIIYDGQDGSEMQSAVFTVPDHKADVGTLLLDNIKFSNRLMGNDLQLKVINGPLSITGLTVRKVYGRAVCILGKTNKAAMMQLAVENDPGKNGYTYPDVKGGLECRRIGTAGAADNQSKCFYFIVTHGVAQKGDTHIAVELEYFDEGTDYLNFEYENASKNVAHRIKKTGTNTWKTKRIELTDAVFDKKKGYYGDFRITNGGDTTVEYVRKVTVTCHPSYSVSGGFEQIGENIVGVLPFRYQYFNQPKRATGALGLYENGRLIEAVYKEITIPPGSFSRTERLTPEKKWKEGQQWKLFVWEDGMRPIKEAAVISWEQWAK